MSVLNNVLPFCFIVMGQKTVASGIASVLNATTPAVRAPRRARLLR